MALDIVINQFLNNKIINTDDIAYRWPPQVAQPNEAAVNERFNRFKRDLHAALNANNEEEIDSCLHEIITVWGRVSLNPSTCMRYRKIMIDLHQHLSNNNFSPFDIAETHYNFIINSLCPVNCTPRYQPPTRLSGWTKALAAYDNTRFWIYDSRVAIALSFLYRDINWYIPPANDQGGKHPQLVNIINAINSRREGMGTTLSPEDSYCLYLRRMGETQNPCHIEKLLFMLGGFLGNKCVDQNNPPNFDEEKFNGYW